MFTLCLVELCLPLLYCGQDYTTLTACHCILSRPYTVSRLLMELIGYLCYPVLDLSSVLSSRLLIIKSCVVKDPPASSIYYSAEVSRCWTREGGQGPLRNSLDDIGHKSLNTYPNWTESMASLPLALYNMRAYQIYQGIVGIHNPQAIRSRCKGF